MRGRRSPTTRSRRCTRTSAWCASAPSSSFVVADIPGLIEGAAEGAGLGHQFLRHLQRTRLLLHLVDLAPFDDSVDPVAQAQAIVAELKKYDPALHDKPRWLVLNKIDMVPRRGARDARQGLRQAPALEGAGVRDLGAGARRPASRCCEAIYEHVADASNARRADAAIRASTTAERETAAHERASLQRRAAHRRQGRLEPGHQRRPRRRRRGDRQLVPPDGGAGARRAARS